MPARRRIQEVSSSDSEDERLVPISWDSIPKCRDRDLEEAEEPRANDWGFAIEDPALYFDYMENGSEEDNRYLFDNPPNGEGPPNEGGAAAAEEEEEEDEFHTAVQDESTEQDQPAVEAQQPDEGGDG
jgi:hypothetical protein